MKKKADITQKITQRHRRIVIVVVGAAIIAAGALFDTTYNAFAPPQAQLPPVSRQDIASQQRAAAVLETLDVKGRAPRTDYNRGQFSDGWGASGNCDVRNLILRRDLANAVLDEDNCTVLSGTLNDPYTNTTITFIRGQDTSQDVQIDHIVAVADAWQKGAQQLSQEQRYHFYNDPLNLLAVDGPTNVKKSDGDAATWLPPSKPYRCLYVARQIAVKSKYDLWVNAAERDAMRRVLRECPDQVLPVVKE